MEREAHGVKEGGDIVTVTRDYGTNTLWERWRNASGRYHRINAPACVAWDLATGLVTYEAWYTNGLSHRVGAPAQMSRDPQTGVIFEEHWREDGVAHRTDGPAVIYRNSKTGKTTNTAWHIKGEWIHSKQLPWSLRGMRRQAIHKQQRQAVLSTPAPK